MTAATWMAIAEALADLRVRLVARRHVGRAQGVEIAAMTVCKVLRSRSRRFDGRRFMATFRTR